MKKSEASSLLKDHASSFAYIAKNHISLSKSDGESYQDTVINNISDSSFIYSSETDNYHVFLLICINEKILLSEEVLKENVGNIIEKYSFKINNGVVFYYKGENPYKGDVKNKSIEVIGTFKKNIAQLKPIKRIQLEAKIRHASYAFLSLAILSVLVVFSFKSFEAKDIQVHKKFEATTDKWNKYKRDMFFAMPGEIAEKINHALSPARLLDKAVIKKITYSNDKILIDMANNGIPTKQILFWSKEKGFKLNKWNKNEFSIEKKIIINKKENHKEIYKIDEVRSLLIDKYAVKNDINVQFSNKESGKNTHKTQGFSMKLTEYPVSVIPEEISFLQKYPVKMTGMTGSLTLGLFSGEINFKIIGE